MSEEKETRVRLLESARQEFMEKGYMRASLRNICKNAGVTTGALYFFFQDKEDLFASLVEEPLQKLYQTMEAHYQAELEHPLLAGNIRGNREAGPVDISDDQEAAAQIVHYLYQYYDEFMMILARSQGSRFEKCVDQFVEISDHHYRMLADAMAEQLKVPPVEDYLIHWLAHMSVDMFVHMLTHEPSEQAALRNVKTIVQYMLDGWIGLFQGERE